MASVAMKILSQAVGLHLPDSPDKTGVTLVRHRARDLLHPAIDPRASQVDGAVSSPRAQEQVYQKPRPRVRTRRRSRRLSVVMNSVEPFSPQPRLVVIAPMRMVPRWVPSAAKTKTASRPAA